jgi:hypothetical protein
MPRRRPRPARRWPWLAAAPLTACLTGNAGRGALILGLYAVGWVLSFFLIGIPLLIGAWIWGMVDGYTSAQRWNQQHGIIS